MTIDHKAKAAHAHLFPRVQGRSIQRLVDVIQKVLANVEIGIPAGQRLYEEGQAKCRVVGSGHRLLRRLFQIAQPLFEGDRIFGIVHHSFLSFVAWSRIACGYAFVRDNKGAAA